MPNSDWSPVGPEEFRCGMRHVPTVVTVVTYDAPEGPVGLTIGSFVSLSLDPPLICFNVQKESSIHDHIVNADRFLVHVLRDDQAHLSDRFAVAEMCTREQLDGEIVEPGPHGIPTLKACLVRFDCRRTQIYDGGDHSILLGLVEQIEEGEPARPIVYHQRAYHAIGTHVADRSTK
jgi:3-hydroxy-9,10-secoandrosta-1,3,5(10)-triene-9,17-dione monooxygenase reductase component